jgi:hypothetical protein
MAADGSNGCIGARVQIIGDLLKLFSHHGPAIEQLLHRRQIWDDISCSNTPGEIPRHDHEGAISGAIAERCKFHGSTVKAVCPAVLWPQSSVVVEMLPRAAIGPNDPAGLVGP